MQTIIVCNSYCLFFNQNNYSPAKPPLLEFQERNCSLHTSVQACNRLTVFTIKQHNINTFW